MEIQGGENVRRSVYSIHSGSTENNKQKAQSKENKADSKEKRENRVKYKGTSSDAEGRDR